MKRASVADLKARLSEFIAAAKRGEDVIITDRGKPVARLTALPDQAGIEAHWAELIRTGAMRPGTGKLPKDFFKPENMGKDPEGAVLQALLDEREEGDW